MDTPTKAVLRTLDTKDTPVLHIQLYVHTGTRAVLQIPDTVLRILPPVTGAHATVQDVAKMGLSRFPWVVMGLGGAGGEGGDVRKGWKRDGD